MSSRYTPGNGRSDRYSSSQDEESYRKPTPSLLLGVNPVVARFESREDWNAHRDAVVDSLRPVGQLELAFAERVAVLLWRIDRIVRFETAAAASGSEEAALELDCISANPELASSKAEALAAAKVQALVSLWEDVKSALAADPDDEALRYVEEKALQHMNVCIDNAQVRRILPDYETMRAIAVYESHLEKCLNKTLRNLRRFQHDRKQRAAS